MKCDKLKPLVFSLNDLAYIDESAVKKNFENPHDHAVYKATEVDEAITEIKAELDKTIAERDGNQVCIDALKQKLESVQASMYCDVVDANMENRRLRRTLWLARAMCAQESQYWGAYVRYVHLHETPSTSLSMMTSFTDTTQTTTHSECGATDGSL